MNDREFLRTSTNVWRSLCDHCELMANCIRKPIRHTFATGETSITFETPQKRPRSFRTATNVWRSFAIITNSLRTAFVSPFAIYSPQCETSITRKFRNGERNLHCDVVHITTVCVCSLTLDCNGVFAIKAYDLMSATAITRSIHHSRERSEIVTS